MTSIYVVASRGGACEVIARAGGVGRFERDEDGTGAGYGQWTGFRREPVSRVAGTGRRPGVGLVGLGRGGASRPCMRCASRSSRRYSSGRWGEGRGLDPARAGWG